MSELFYVDLGVWSGSTSTRKAGSDFNYGDRAPPFSFGGCQVSKNQKKCAQKKDEML